MNEEYLKGCEPKKKDIDEDNIERCFKCGEPFDMYDTQRFNIMRYYPEANTIDDGIYTGKEKQCKQCFFKNVIFLAKDLIRVNHHIDFGFFIAKKNRK